MRRLETEFDFWEGWVEGRTLVTQFGRKGVDDPRVVRWSRESAEAAEAALAQSVVRRTGRGMVEVEVRLPPVRSPSLEERIRERPDDLDAWRVYADWLQERGNEPGWGKLVAVELEIVTLGGSPARFARRSDLRDELYGDVTLPLFPSEGPMIAEESNRVDLRFGFIERLVGNQVVGPPAAWRFARHAVFVPGNHGLDDFLRALVKGEASALESLRIVTNWQEVSMLAWLDGARFGSFEHFPHLEVLELAGSSLGLSSVRAPALRRLVLQALSIDATTITAIAEGSLPVLEDLELWMGGHHGENVGCTAEDVAAILSRDPRDGHLGSLKRLALRSSAFTDALIPHLVNSPLLPELTQLDLSMGTMTDAGARLLAAHATRFAHLSLDLSENLIADGSILAALPDANLAGQRAWDDEEGYPPYAAVVE